jgi:hypothetical protein
LEEVQDDIEVEEGSNEALIGAESDEDGDDDVFFEPDY